MADEPEPTPQTTPAPAAPAPAPAGPQVDPGFPDLMDIQTRGETPPPPREISHETKEG